MSLVNLNRLRTKKVVSLFPGIHLRKLQRVMNTSFNTTRYHVHNLERDGEIVSWREGGLERLYPAGFQESGMKLNALLLDKTARKIITTLLEKGPMGNGGLSSSTGLAKSTVSEHVDAMRRAEVVRRVIGLDGNPTYELVDRAATAAFLESFRRSLLTSAADSFIDLWDL